MAQRIQQAPPSNMPYAAEAMSMANVARGNGGMNLPNAGVPNAFDGGAVTKAAANPQLQMNFNHEIQNQQQNGMTNVFQQQAGAAGMARKAIAAESDATFKAQSALNNQLAQVMLASPSQGQGMMRFQNQFIDPVSANKFKTDIAVSQAMYQQGIAADLAAGQMEANRYA